MKWFFKQLRFGFKNRLLLVAVLAMIPSLLLVWRHIIEQRSYALLVLQDNSLRLLQGFYTGNQDAVETIRDMLATMTHIDYVQQRDTNATSRYLKDIVPMMDLVTSLTVLDKEGKIWAASGDLSAHELPEDAGWYQTVLKSRKWMTSEIRFDPRQESFIMQVSYPITDQHGNFNGAIIAYVDIGILMDYQDFSRLPAEAGLVLLDHDDQVVAGVPFYETWRKQREAFAKAMKQARAEGKTLATLRDENGKEWLLTWLVADIHTTPIINVCVVPREVVFREIGSMISGNLIWMGLAFLIAVIVAHWAGEWLLVRPMNQLVTATQTIASGDYQVRAKLRRTDEIGALAEAMDSMAEALGKREMENREATIEREKLLRQLKQQQQITQAMLDAASETIMLLDHRGVVLMANKTCAERVNRKQEELVGLLAVDLVGSSVGQGRADMGLKVIESGKPVVFEDIRDGLYVEHHFCPVLDINGGPPMLAIFSRDITQRKQMELALRASEAKIRESERNYREIFNGINDGVIIHDTETGLLLDINNIMLEMVGLDRRDVIGQPAGSMSAGFAPYTAVEALVWLRKAIKAPQTFDWLLRCKNRELLWVEVSLRKAEIGGRPRILATVRDIAERKRAQLALQEASEFNRQIVSGANEGVVVVDRSLRLIGWNPFMERMTGLKTNRVLGKPVGELFPFLKSEGVITYMERALQGDFNVTPDFYYHLPETGSAGWVSHKNSPMYNARGEIIGVIGVVTDITERKNSESELSQSRQQLRALAERMENMREEERARIAREVHDNLGQMLTGVKFDFARFAKRLPESPDYKERVVEINKLLDACIQTVREISRELRPGILDDIGLFEAVDWQTQEFTRRTGIECEYLPLTECPSLRQEQATAIFRILQEALTNVARHAQATRVEVVLEDQSDWFVLKVQDNGRGIKPADMVRSDSLGVLGMRERALAVQGEVSFSSEPGKGTTVSARFRIQPGASARTEAT